MIVVIHRFRPNIAQLLISKIRMRVILQQSDIAVVGGGHPLLFAVLLDEFVEEFTDGEIIAVDVGVLSGLILQLCLARLRGIVTQARLPDLMPVLSFPLVENERVCLSSFDD